jgi:diaminopimelate epimerase
MTSTLTKHHGLGNDFLVYDVAQGLPPSVDGTVPWPALARRWCDRRRGIGADGLLLLEVTGDEELSMRLLNADGSPAEMSGNGIRCLVQAAFVAQGRTAPVAYTVHTDAGDRRVEVLASDDGGRRIEASVEMGEVQPIDAPAGWQRVGADPMRPVAHLSVGNPHSVIAVDEVAVVDLAGIGALVPSVNLEVVEPGPEPHAITMRVHERGAGITEACGTGACASAWAASSWGMVPADVADIVVHMDGGDARVRIDRTAVTLVGPAELVAHVQIHA